MKKCTNCNSEMFDDAKFCTSCGAKAPEGVEETQTQQEETQSEEREPGEPREQPVQDGSAPPPPPPPQTPPPHHMQAPYPQAQPAYGGPAPAAQPEKKGHGCIIAVIVVLGIFLLSVVGMVLLVLGVIRPGAGRAMSNETNYTSALSKLNFTEDEAPEEGQAGDYLSVYSDNTTPVSTNLTSEEATSFMSYNKPSYYPMQGTRLTFNEDGTTDISTRLNTNFVITEMLLQDFPEEEYDEFLSVLDILPSNLNIRANFEGRIINNRLENFSVNSMSIYFMPIPESILENPEMMEFIEDVVSHFIQRRSDITGTQYNRLEVVDGELVFEGVVPESLERVKKQP